MKLGLTLFGGALAAAALATTAIGDGHVDKSLQQAIGARKAQMQMYAFNLGLLGGMAKGEIEYSAEAASAAAGNLAALTQLDQSRLWPVGSDGDALGTDVTKASAAIWTADSKASEIGMALAQASMNLEQVAGNGLDALRGGMGDVGKNCGACHQSYQLK